VGQACKKKNLERQNGIFWKGGSEEKSWTEGEGTILLRSGGACPQTKDPCSVNKGGKGRNNRAEGFLGGAHEGCSVLNV